MFRLGLGLFIGWLAFDEKGKQVSEKAGEYVKKQYKEVAGLVIDTIKKNQKEMNDGNE